jgi:secreted protein with Ig-like and vWFA domain
MQWMRVWADPACGVHLHRTLYFYKYQLAPFIALMRTGLLSLIIFAAFFLAAPVVAQGATLPVIASPSAGQILQGKVSITGTTDILNFASAELDFAYASDATGTWFLIQSFSQPIANSALVVWDTTSISDGDYVLRLRVTLQDGSFQDTAIKVKVQNDAPIPTAISTAAPTATSAPTLTPQPSVPTQFAASSTPTTPPFSTPTALPSNPAEVQTNQIYAGIQRGALIIVGLFIFFGILIRLRRT